MIQDKLESLLEETVICNDPETIGFDLCSGKQWIYPENYPKREYQFTIVQIALHNNTLVCLPTGLGKTFIAAVIMYNFWRWYPKGRVIFLAPTRPLVAQQINACNEIMGIPYEETIELTGAIKQNKRQQAWKQKRVIFATPQTFQKDLQNNCVPYELIKCIVFDEAHKALKKHSYCEIIRILNDNTKFFRVLALSATPGNKIDHVRQVIQNLHISKLVLRDDTSPDIIPYINERSIDKVIVCLSKELNTYKERYISIMDHHVRILIKFKVLQGDLTNISKGKIFMLRKQYEMKSKSTNISGVIMKTLNILLTMYHGYELLLKHGLRAFYNFYFNHSEKWWLETELDLQLLLKDIKQYIGNLPEIKSLLNNAIVIIPQDFIFGHTKFYKLSDILQKHFELFSQQGRSTRVIVFVEYRDIVNEIYVLLLQQRPLIRPQIFVGRAGQSQKQQLTALKDFKNNKVNVLISTSVGEEGLDVGEVDLIVCFDISTSTPIRFIQRIGRTGRKRNGRVVVLLTAGKEEETFSQALSKTNCLNEKVLQSSKITSSLYKSSPRMIPANIKLQCLPTFINVHSKRLTVGIKKKKQLIEKNNISENNYAAVLTPCKKKFKTKNCENSQFTMKKFLTDKEKMLSSCIYDIDSGISAEELQKMNGRRKSIENLYSDVQLKDVKLFSDNNILEFLTLYTIQISEKKTLNHYLLKSNKTWIPTYSSVHAFDEFNIPSLKILDCINDVTSYNYPDDNETVSLLNKFNSFFYRKEKTIDNQQKCSFIEAKSIQILRNTNFKKKEKIEIIKSDIYEDFCKIDSKYIENSEKIDFQNQNIEMFIPKLFDNSFFLNLKYNQSINFENIDFSKTKSCNKFSKILMQLNANVEVDFQNILDEYTDSEESTYQHLIYINQFKETKKIDNLVNQASSDEDIFKFSQDNQNISNVPKDNFLINSSKFTTKRSADNTVYQESTIKKKKFSNIDTSDSESPIIFSTPPKSKEIRLFSNTNDNIIKSVLENDHSDSDQDIFDNFLFARKLRFTLKNEKTKIKKHIKFRKKHKYEFSFFKDINNELENKIKKIPINTKRIRENVNRNKIISKNMTEENINKNNNELSNLKKEEESFSNIDKRKKLESMFFEDEENSLHFNKNISTQDIIDPNINDWTQNFNFLSSVNNINNKKKYNTSHSIKKSSYSNQISILKDIIKEQPNIKLDLNNISIISSPRKKLNFSKNSNDLLTNSLLNNETNSFVNVNDKYNNLNIRNMQSKLHLFNLKKNSKGSINDKKKKFILSQCKVNSYSDIKPYQLSIPGESEKNDAKEQNKFTNLKVNEKTKKDSSSQFQNEINKKKICNKRNETKRKTNKFIDNEAMVSSDYETTEESSGEDADLTNFVSYTQEQLDTTDVRADYLQTINKSPIRSGGFVFKPLKNMVPDFEIYSQLPSQIDDTYVNDSFCVENETSADNNTSDTTIENIKFNLENKQKMKKKKNLKLKNIDTVKKEINCNKNISNECDTTSSSEDEIESLRKQVLEESKLLKQMQR